MTDLDDRVGGQRPSPMRGAVPFVLILCFGLTVSFAAFRFVDESGRRERDDRFMRLAVERLARVEEKLNNAAIKLRAARSYFLAAPRVDRAAFSAFVGNLGIGDGIQALAWIPRVLGERRAAMVQAARQGGFPNFQITERQRQNVMPRRGEQKEYFPVYYIEPYRGNEMALGFDLASAPLRLAVLEKAARSGRMVASGRIRLVQEKQQQPGLLLVTPVYARLSDLTTAEQRRQALTGFVAIVFRVGDLIASAAPARPDRRIPIAIRLLDLAGGEGEQ